MKVTILGTSDIHGFYQPWDYSKDQYATKGGLSRISTVLKEIKAENKNTMILDCGDLIQGNGMELFIDDDKFPGIEIVNHMGYEILTMGNHEFNFGTETLKKVIKQFKGISMMGNLYSKEGYRQMNAIYIKHFGPVKIAFISLNTPLVRDFEEKRGNLKGLDITDADVELRKILGELDDLGEFDAIIGTFHMGDKNENNIPNTGVRDLLYGIDEAAKIDAIFGGHMHKVIPGIKIRNTIFLQPGSKAVSLNRLDLYFDLSKKKKLVDIKASTIDIDESIESDKEIENILEPYHLRLRSYANEYVGYIDSGNMTPEDQIPGLPQTRIAQSDVSDFFLDVMLHYSKADVASTHLDNPYPVMPGGKVKRKHIYNSYSYSGGDICKYEISGLDLRDYMEWSAGYFNQCSQGDISISFEAQRYGFKYSTFDIFGNVKYEIDLTKPMGSRILNLRHMDNSPIKNDDILSLAINKYRMDFLTSSIGPLHDRNFDLIWSSMTDQSLGVRGTIRNLSMKFLQEYKEGVYRPRKEERWHIITNKLDPSVKKTAVDMMSKGIICLPKLSNGEIDLTVSKNIYSQISEEEYRNLVDNYRGKECNITRNMSIIDIIYSNNCINT